MLAALRLSAAVGCDGSATPPDEPAISTVVAGISFAAGESVIASYPSGSPRN